MNYLLFCIFDTARYILLAAFHVTLLFALLWLLGKIVSSIQD